MIYFMQDVNGGPVKIGHTGDLSIRHRQLEEYYGRSLAVLATMPGGRKEEAEIHSRFKHLQLRGARKRQGCRPEQFKPSPDLMEFIGRPLLAMANAENVEVMTNRMKTIGIRGSGEWCAWLERTAQYLRIDVAKMLEIAVVKYAKKTGFHEPPPRRI